jgi:tetratricopeptide (TPR) repeat protein
MRRTPGILLLFLLITGLSVAQDIREPLVRFSHPILDRINAMVEAKKYKGAIDLSLTTADQMRAQSNREGYISFMLRAAEIETFEVWKGKGFPGVEIYPDYRRPRKYLDSLYTHAGKIIEEYPYLKANVLFTNAVVYEWLGMPNKAELMHNESLELRKNLYGKSSREVADSYLWRGVLYTRGLQRKDLAERDYRMAQELQKKFMPDSRYALGSVYFRLAEIATENFQFDEALTLANQYLSLYHDLPYEQAFGKQLIANVYWHQKDFEKALESRRQAIKIYKESDFEEDLIVEYSNLASDLVNLKRYDEAKQVLQEGERILNTSNIWDDDTQMLFENFGNLYFKTKNYGASAFYLNKAMRIAMAQYGGRSDKVAALYSARGRLFIERELFENGLDDYQKMLTALIPEFQSTDYRKIPEVQYENPYFKYIIEANFNKADAFLTWFKSASDIRHLELALDNYRAAYHQLIIARQSIGDELSKPFLMSNFHESVENSVACAYILYRRTNNQKFIQDILYFVELTKYLNVLDALQRAERSSNSEVPAELLFELKSTREELNKLQRLELQREHLALSTDSVANLRDQVLNLIGKRRELISEIAKYSGHTVANVDNMMSMGDIKKQLKSDEQIVEFFFGRDSIYSISITNEVAEVKATANDPKMDTVLLSVRNMLEGQRSFKTGQVERYSTMTCWIYHRLFQFVINKRKVIVIPDGALNLIPIEALVIAHQPEKLTFKDLAYLIYEHEITYAYSSSILFHKTIPDETETSVNQTPSGKINHRIYLVHIKN